MTTAGNYDRIARFYDVDMGRNMAFDDVGFYVGVCERNRGSVLELGCGNGRILLELLTRGMDAVGVDDSVEMLLELRRRAVARALDAPVAQMDVRVLALRPVFNVALCPYSLINYLTEDDELARTVTGIRAVLRTGGLLVVDSFVPQPVFPEPEFRPDYRRPFESHSLVRFRRVTPLNAYVNRIERSYRVLSMQDELLEQIDVVEDIRPYAPDDLGGRIAGCGFSIDQVWWNYQSTQAMPRAQFFTIVARAA